MNNIFTNYLEKLGSNFIVSAMIPSLALVVACMLVFEPILHISNMFIQKDSIYPLISFSLLLVIPTVIIGFTLTALNTYILKLFEGYVFFPHLSYMYKWMLHSHRNKARKLITTRRFLKRRIDVIEQSVIETTRQARHLKKLKNEFFLVAAKYDQSYPPRLGDILPTQFGNILKASETYSGIRYGMDAVNFWPRLFHVIHPDYKTEISNTRNELSFLVNMSLLSIVFLACCLGASFYTLVYPPLDVMGKTIYVAAFANVVRYIVLGGTSLLLNMFFNKASIYAVGSYGQMIRSAYDLFRLDLLKQLRLKMPNNSHEEFYTWKNLNEFIVLGQYSISLKRLEYDVTDVHETQQEDQHKKHHNT